MFDNYVFVSWAIVFLALVTVFGLHAIISARYELKHLAHQQKEKALAIGNKDGWVKILLSNAKTNKTFMGLIVNQDYDTELFAEIIEDWTLGKCPIFGFEVADYDWYENDFILENLGKEIVVPPMKDTAVKIVSFGHMSGWIKHCYSNNDCVIKF